MEFKFYKTDVCETTGVSLRRFILSICYSWEG
jgi:hypothetical protein